MRILQVALMLGALSLLAGSRQSLPEMCDQMVYQDSNQLAPPVMDLGLAEGVVQDDYRGLRMPMACVGVFTEPDHKRVAVGKADQRGRFALSGVPAGTYRLVATYPSFCPANQTVRIVGKRGKTALVHMSVRGIDTCSWIDNR